MTVKTNKTPAPQRAGTARNEKRARLVRLMLEIASLDRDEYRRMRAEIWQAAAKSHERKPAKDLRTWMGNAS